MRALPQQDQSSSPFLSIEQNHFTNKTYLYDRKQKPIGLLFKDSKAINQTLDSVNQLIQICAQLTRQLSHNVGEVMNNHREIAKELTKKLNAIGIEIPLQVIEQQNVIVNYWTLKDVKNMRQDLTDEQARKVLADFKSCGNEHYYEVFDTIISNLFPLDDE